MTWAGDTTPREPIVYTYDAAGATDRTIWTADRGYYLKEIRHFHGTVSTSGTLRPRKITDTSAPGAAASTTVIELTTATLDLAATINTEIKPTLVTSADARLFKPGDRLCLDFGGTMTGLVGAATTFVFVPYPYRGN